MGADLGGARPAGEIRIGLGFGNAGDVPFDAHLAAEGIPVQKQRRAWIRLELLALPARRVRVEDDALLVELLQEHHAHRGCTVHRRRRERARLRHSHRDGGVGEPAQERRERIVRVEVGAPQRAFALAHEIKD